MESAGVRYLRTSCFCIRNLTRSLRSLVRFLIRQQLVRKYCTPALFMKYSLYTTHAQRKNDQRSCFQRDKDERNGIYSSPRKVISDAILICFQVGARVWQKLG